MSTSFLTGWREHVNEHVVVMWQEKNQMRFLGSLSSVNKCHSNLTLLIGCNNQAMSIYFAFPVTCKARKGKHVKRMFKLILPLNQAVHAHSLSFEQIKLSELGPAAAQVHEAGFSLHGSTIRLTFQLAECGYVITPTTKAQAIEPHNGTSAQLLREFHNLSAARRMTAYLKPSDYARQGLRTVCGLLNGLHLEQARSVMGGMQMMDWSMIKFSDDPPAYDDPQSPGVCVDKDEPPRYGEDPLPKRKITADVSPHVLVPESSQEPCMTDVLGDQEWDEFVAESPMAQGLSLDHIQPTPHSSPFPAVLFEMSPLVASPAKRRRSSPDPEPRAAPGVRCSDAHDASMPPSPPPVASQPSAQPTHGHNPSPDGESHHPPLSPLLGSTHPLPAPAAPSSPHPAPSPANPEATTSHTTPITPTTPTTLLTTFFAHALPHDPFIYTHPHIAPFLPRLRTLSHHSDSRRFLLTFSRMCALFFWDSRAGASSHKGLLPPPAAAQPYVLDLQRLVAWTLGYGLERGWRVEAVLGRVFGGLVRVGGAARGIMGFREGKGDGGEMEEWRRAKAEVIVGVIMG